MQSGDVEATLLDTSLLESYIDLKFENQYKRQKYQKTTLNGIKIIIKSRIQICLI